MLSVTTRASASEDTSKRTILLSVGTSVFAPHFLEDDRYREERSHGANWYREKVGELDLSTKQLAYSNWMAADTELATAAKQRIEALCDAVSSSRQSTAELDTLKLLTPPLGKGDTIHIFASDTEIGVLAARIISAVIKKRWRVAGVKLHRLEGLDVQSPDKLPAACFRLLRRAAEILRTVEQREKRLCVLTGGYKLMMAYLTLAALLFDAEIVYLHESNAILHSLPRASFIPDFQIWNRYFILFERLQECSCKRPMPRDIWNKMLASCDPSSPPDKVRADLEAFVEEVQKEDAEGITLSTIGEVLHQRAQESYRDPTTSLYRRSFYDQALRHWIERVEPRGLGVIIADIDHFKRINDRYRHATGDKVLEQVAKALQEVVARYHHAWLLRWGGEEFVTVMVNPESPAKVFEVAESMRKNVEKLQVIVSNCTDPIKVTITAGCATWPDDYSELPPTHAFEKLLDLADKALYKGKQSGRNRVERGRNYGGDDSAR